MQSKLSSDQLFEFYHDEFVLDQIQHFSELFDNSEKPINGVLVDVGGGVGYFARIIQEQSNYSVRVIDTDPVSINRCKLAGLEAIIGDATNLDPMGDEAVVCFNLILHHLVSTSDKKTKELQTKAINVWKRTGCTLFINEYIYDSYLKNISGWLIYHITKSQILSTIGKVISSVVPTLRANTFGVGVRFRSHKEWETIFKEEGFTITGVKLGKEETVKLPLRLLLIKTIRRDSYLLKFS